MRRRTAAVLAVAAPGLAACSSTPSTGAASSAALSASYDSTKAAKLLTGHESAKDALDRAAAAADDAPAD